MHVLRGKLRKYWCERCRAFPERVRPRILSLEIVDYFGTNEYFGGRKKENSVNEKNSEGEANWSGVVNFHCMQIESCDKHSVYFWRWLKWRAIFITFLHFGNDVISPESRPLIFAYLCMRTQSIQKQIVEYDINVNILKNTRPSIK